MGRSFIRPEHQRSFTGLLLLWKGIGRYVVRDPDCATLFGPVSISAEYRTASQQLMVAFLKQNLGRHPFARWVRPRTPFRERPSRVIRRGVADLGTLEEASQFIAEIEGDGKGVPILLRQYLKLGGALLGFNVDPEFANVLDVLVLVDLRRTPEATLRKYMGADGATAFRARHSG
jgi:putative hemolysin